MEFISEFIRNIRGRWKNAAKKKSNPILSMLSENNEFMKQFKNLLITSKGNEQKELIS